MKKSSVTKVLAREVLDSRGNPTIETTVWSGNIYASASVPSGASTGTHEALDLRDGDKKRYGGKGVLTACKNVNEPIAKKVVGMNPFDQKAIDGLMLAMDGTPNKGRLGANSILSVSLAVARLASRLEGVGLYQYLAKTYGYKPGKMPVPLFNVINGGAHADSGLDIQEFFIIPQKGKFSERLRQGAEVYQQLKKDLSAKKLTVSIGDEGGFAPHLGKNENGFEVLARAIQGAGYKLGTDFALGIDAASSEFFDAKTGTYNLAASGRKYTPKTIASMYKQWFMKYHLQIIEDGCAEDDFIGWKAISAELGKKTILVGDDLFVTNMSRLQRGIDEGIANAILIKVNQIGSLTETLQAIQLAQKNKYKVVISHRSGETNDDFIADLAVAVNADFAKMGSLARGERLAKYNRLMAIEAQL
jgi:enolase